MCCHSTALRVRDFYIPLLSAWTQWTTAGRSTDFPHWLTFWQDSIGTRLCVLWVHECKTVTTLGRWKVRTCFTSLVAAPLSIAGQQFLRARQSPCLGVCAVFSHLNVRGSTFQLCPCLFLCSFIFLIFSAVEFTMNGTGQTRGGHSIYWDLYFLFSLSWCAVSGSRQPSGDAFVSKLGLDSVWCLN